MSKLDDLIAELCHDGVEYKTLGKVCDFRNGFAFKSNLFSDIGLTIIRITNINGKNVDLSNVKYFNPADYRENTQNYEVTKGDILIAMSGATTGKIGYYDCERTAYLNQRVGKFMPKIDMLNNRYLYHFLLSKVEEIYVSAGGGAQPNLSSNVLMSKMAIPLPPLPIQEEIVRILDNFTELTAELTAELTDRKKQYEYYRDKLLTFGDDVEWKELRDVLKIKNGKDYKQYDVGEIPVYGSGGVMTYINQYSYNKTSVLIPRKGSIDKLYYVDIPFWNVDTIFYTDIYIDIVITKFVFYFLQKEHLEQYNTAGGVPSLTQTVLNRLAFPVPPLTEQQRIVAILDRFDTLCNDISKGLPAEIEERQKQYEYYRDKLLTFKKKEA